MSTDLHDTGDDLDDELRTAFAELARTSPISSASRFGDVHISNQPRQRPPTRFPALVAAAAVVVLVAGLVVVVRSRDRDIPPITQLATAPPVRVGEYLFPDIGTDGAPVTAYSDPTELAQDYLDQVVTTAPPGQPTTAILGTLHVNDGGDGAFAIFNLMVGVDGQAGCCDSGDGVIVMDRIARSDGTSSWFVVTAGISVMNLGPISYSDGTIAGSFAPRIGGTYLVSVEEVASPGDAPGIARGGSSIALDVTSDTSTMFDDTGFGTDAVSVTFWQTPGADTPYPAAMFAQVIVRDGETTNADLYPTAFGDNAPRSDSVQPGNSPETDQPSSGPDATTASTPPSPLDTVSRRGLNADDVTLVRS